MPPQPIPQQSQPNQKLFMDLSGRGGLAPRWFGDEGDTIAQYPQYRYLGDQDQTPTYSYKSTASQFAAGVYNPTRRYGFMAPAPNSYTTITNNTGGGSFKNEWRCTLYDSAMTTAFAGENGDQMVNSNSVGGTVWQTSLGGFNPGIANCTAVTDLESYQVNGVRQVFFAYQKASSGDIGICVTSGGAPVSNNNTWMSGTSTTPPTLGTGNDYFMTVADNGYMYVGDGNKVHKFDGTSATGGTNGTWTANVLVAPPSFVFLDGVDFKGSLWLAVEDAPVVISDTSAFSGNTCGVYLWDRQSTIVNMVDFIPLKGIKNIKKIFVTQEGRVRVLCLSSKRTTQIREFDGSVFQIIDEQALVSFPLYRDSVAIAGSLVYWMGSDGRMYSYGAITGGEQEQLYIIGDMTSIPQSSFNAGAILFIDANASTTVTRTAVCLSIKDATPTVYNRIWYPNAVGGTPSTGNVFTLVKYFPVPVKINYARVWHNAGNTSGATQQGTLSIFLNQATSANKTFAITRDDIGKGYKYCPLNQGLKNVVIAIQAEIQWSAVNIADATDWMPRVLEIDYEPIPRLL